MSRRVNIAATVGRKENLMIYVVRRIILWLCVPLMAGMSFAQDEPPRYVEYATYLGGSGSEIAFDVAADSAGNIFLAGSTSSPDFLAGVGFGAVESHGGRDAVIVKLDPDGLEVLSVAVVGGPGPDLAHALRVTSAGDVFVLGDVAAGFTPPPTSCREAVGGSSDLFVARLDNNLEIEDLQLLGGSGEDGARDLHVSDDGTLSVVGYTSSRDLATTSGALQASFQGGGYDNFVVRIRLGEELTCQDRVAYSTYLGSAGSEADPSGAPFPGAIDVDPSALVTVAGMTGDPQTFPSTDCSYRSHPRGTDVFVTQLRCDPELPASDQLVYGALIGGTDWDAANGVEVTTEGRVRVTGVTFSSDFPSTTSRGHAGGNDCFVLELDPRCELSRPDDQLRFSTLIGGSSVDPPTLVRTQADGSMVIAGVTASSNFPLTGDGLGAFAGLQQPYLCVLAPPRTKPGTAALRFSTPLSSGAACRGPIIECNRVLGLTLLPDQTMLACGTTSGALLGVPRDALQPFSAGGPEMFLYKLDLKSPQVRIGLRPPSGVAPLTVCFDVSDSTPAGTTLESYVWDFGDGTSGEGAQACHVYEVPGLHTTRLEVRNSLDLVGTAQAIVKVSCARGDVSPWISADIGDVAFGGGSRREATGDRDLIAVCSAGVPFSGSRDAFHFVHQNPPGPARLEAVVESLEGGGTRPVAGVAWRENIDPDARFVALVVRVDGSLRFLRRERPGASIRGEEKGSLALPMRLRLDRQGAEFVVSARSEAEAGASFQELGRVLLDDALSASPMGLAVTAEQIRVGDPRVEVKFSVATLAPLGTGWFVRGDCNDDGKVNISDAVCVLDWLFLGGTTPGCIAVTNTNGDTGEDISDATYLLNHLFLGGPAPVAPYPECGPGTLPIDEEGCETPPQNCQQ